MGQHAAEVQGILSKGYEMMGACSAAAMCVVRARNREEGGPPPSFSFQINDETYDGEARVSNYSDSDTPMRIGEVGALSLLVGFYIPNVTIVNAQTLDAAKLEFTTLVTGGTLGKDCDSEIYLDDVDTAAIFTDVGGNRPLDIAFTTAFTATGLADSTFYSIDIVAVLQEILDRPGWSSGNNLRGVILANVSTAKDHWVELDSYGANASTAIKLTADWS